MRIGVCPDDAARLGPSGGDTWGRRLGWLHRNEFTLELEGGTGDAIPPSAGRSLRVLGVRDDDADQPPVLVVEDLRDQGGISED